MRAESGVRLCGDGIYHRAEDTVKPSVSPSARGRGGPGSEAIAAAPPTHREPPETARGDRYRTSTWKGMIASGCPAGSRATVAHARSIGGTAIHASASSSGST
jgi:hypothetical protein